MFYSDNLLLSAVARRCKESAVAVADAYNIYVFDLLHLDSSCLRMFSGTILLLLLICNGVLVFLVLVFTFQFVVYVFSVSFLAQCFNVLLKHILFCAALCVSNNNNNNNNNHKGE